MNYIIYGRGSQMLHRSNTETEAREWMDRNAKKFKDYGMRVPLMVLCYNGTKSVEIMRMGE